MLRTIASHIVPAAAVNSELDSPSWYQFGPRSTIVASPPLRLGDVIGGHVHPSLCVTQSGAVLCVYNTDGGGAQVLLLCRSDECVFYICARALLNSGFL